MSIGAGILLVAIGAILAFAVNWQLGGLDLDVVGWVLMIAGLAGIVITLAYSRRRTRHVVEQTRPEGRVVERQTQVYDDPNAPPPPV